ncbi:MAG: acyltransferase [Pseudomonadota bacterium]
MQQSNHLPALDSLRGIAVLAVLLGHLDYYFFGRGFDLFPGGFIGVDLFFVLSGFLITRNLLHDINFYGRVRLGRFYQHRVLRLAPALLIFILTMAPTLLLLNLVDGSDLVRAVLAAVFYVYNWFVYTTLTEVPGFGHLWSLSVEEQFYLLWPVLLCIFPPRNPFRRRLWMLVSALAIIGVYLLRQGLWNEGYSWLQLYVRTDLRADALLCGALLAFLEAQGVLKPLGEGVRVPTALLSTLFVLATLSLGYDDAFLYKGGMSLIAILCTGLVYCAIACECKKRVRRISLAKTLGSLGRISYGVYVYHMPIIMSLASDIGTHIINNEIVRLLLAIQATLLCAYLSYGLIERPAIDQKAP